jgi:hypothetical protein
MHTYEIDVYRDGRWWMIRIPEIDGLTQARHRGEIDDMARSYIAVSTGQPIDTIAVRVAKITGDEPKCWSAHGGNEIRVRKTSKTVPNTAYSAYHNVMGATESRWNGGIFAVNPALIPCQNKTVLLIGARPQPGQPAPLSLDTRKVAIHRQSGPVRGHERFANLTGNRW